MTFLNTLFLVALPLVAVPVLIHLSRGRQRDVIPWAAMEFLEKAMTTGRRLQRLEEWLLMALRAGVIAALVLALARPMVSSRWWGGGPARDVVLVVDNSLSTSREVAGGSVFDQLMERAQSVVNGLSSTDRVHLLLAAESVQWLTPEGIAADRQGKSQLHEILETLEPSRGAARLLDSLQRAVHFDSPEGDSTGGPSSRRVVVLTDSQAKSWQTEAEGAWQQLGSVLCDATVPTKIAIVDCSLGNTEIENLAVGSLKSLQRSTRPGETIDVVAEVFNFGAMPSDGTTVRWLADGEEFSSSLLPSIAPNQSLSVTTTFAPRNSGTYVIACRIEAADQLALDQEEHLVVEVSDQHSVLLVHEPSNFGPSKPTDELFAAALGYDQSQPQRWHSVYRPKTTSFAHLGDARLSDYRAIVLDRLQELDAEMIKRLQDYVRSGGGLWITLGDAIDRNAFNRQWHDNNAGLSPLKLDRLTQIGDTNSPAGRIHPPSRKHPATVQLASTTQLDFNEARLSKYWRFAKKGSEQEVSLLLETGNGNPLVAEHYLGRGRVLVQAFPLGLEWSNLPRLKAYVVMINDWLDYLTAPATARYNLIPGEAIVAAAPDNLGVRVATLQTPSGQTVSLPLQPMGDAEVVRYSQTNSPGLYRIAFEDRHSTNVPFHVARDTSESQLTTLNPEEREQLSKLADLSWSAEEMLATPETNMAASSAPVWEALLLFLILLLACELLLANWLARQRREVAVSTF